MYKTRLKEIRTLELISQKDFAKLIDVCQNTFSEYENEYKIIPITHLNTICNHFNVSLDYIFNFTNLKQYVNSKVEINVVKSSERLKELRKDNKISQQCLASSIGTAKTTISGYERCARMIATPFLYDICKNYNISADYLLGKIDFNPMKKDININ